jgi:hypothetical protein
MERKIWGIRIKFRIGENKGWIKWRNLDKGDIGFKRKRKKSKNLSRWNLKFKRKWRVIKRINLKRETSYFR